MRSWLSIGPIILVYLILSVSCGGPEQSVQERGRNNIILIILDTLRAENLSCYGYYRDTSPALDSLAECGTRWTSLQAQAPWTLPAHATIWTGLSVQSHRTLNPVSLETEGEDRLKLIYKLDTDLPSLPVILRDAGFATFGVVNFAILSDVYGFDQGFDEYHCHPTGEGQAAVSVDMMIEWLEEHRDERFFCVMHLYDIHSPYAPPAPYNSMFQDDPELVWFDWEIDGDSILNAEEVQTAIDMYDGEIRWVDDNLSRLFAWLRTNGLEGETMIVVMADHGEEFLEHGWVLHGTTLYQEVLHVPLIMSGPGIPAGVVDSTRVGQFDILPTLIAWAGLESDAYFDGVNILEDPDPYRSIPSSETSLPPWTDRYPLASSVSGSVKTIMMNDMEEFVTYRLDEDPQEIQPLPGDSIGMESVLYYWATPPRGFPEFAQSDPRSIQALRDLGYID
ncbi:MAG: hypothetical protein AVO35_05695 [Candidatus Aegiribacteria sp. MLS_C]|nr:MAG: hypothetical protein AVO35_05695 [Candidatus Aegiribacteria sp. MLS_C]